MSNNTNQPGKGNRRARSSGGVLDRTVDAIATFALLMHAAERGESAKQDSAKRDLEQLGVLVKLTIPPRSRGGRS